MALNYILKRIASQMGFDYDSNPDQRLLALDQINIACEAIWEETDLPGCCNEIVINVLANNEMACPTYLGELRATREQALMHKWEIKDMRPRYQCEPWKQMWRNWRHLGKRATQLPVTNSAPLTFLTTTPDGTTVTVTGSTASANRVTDSITFDTANMKVGVVSFTSIESIIKPDGTNLQDIAITDSAGNVMAILYNNETETSYIVVDVSQYPFGGETQNNERVMEVLYKRRLSRLENDTDTFPVPGWDNVIVDRTLQAFAEGEEGKEQRAILFATKVEKQSKQKIRHQEGGIEKEIQFTENPFYGITKRPYSRVWRG